jgi:hypothetical protein
MKAKSKYFVENLSLRRDLSSESKALSESLKTQNRKIII